MVGIVTRVQAMVVAACFLVQQVPAMGQPASTHATVIAGSLSAQQQLNEGEQPTERTTPEIATTPDGFVAVWESRQASANDSSGSHVTARFYDATSGTLAAELPVNFYPQGNQERPVIASKDQGGVVVVFEDQSKQLGDNDTGIAFQLFDQTGNRIGDERLANAFTRYVQRLPAVAAKSNGDFVVAWEDLSRAFSTASTSQISARVFKSDGSQARPQFMVNADDAAFTHLSPSIAVLDNDWVVVAWHERSLRTGPDGKYIVKNRFRLYDEDFIQQEVENDVISDSGVLKLSSLGTGFVAVWEDRSGKFEDQELPCIVATVYDSNGKLISPTFQVNTQAGSEQNNARVGSVGDNAAVVVWDDFSGTLGDSYAQSIKFQVIGRWVDSTIKVGRETLVNEKTVGPQIRPSTTGLRNGDFVAAWYDWRDGYHWFRVFSTGNHGATGIVRITGEPRVTQVIHADSSEVADVDGVGTFFFQWQRSENRIDWDNITGAVGGDYRIQVDDIGTSLRVLVQYIDGAGNPESLTSLSTIQIGADVVEASAHAIFGEFVRVATIVNDNEFVSAVLARKLSPDGINAQIFVRRGLDRARILSEILDVISALGKGLEAYRKNPDLSHAVHAASQDLVAVLGSGAVGKFGSYIIVAALAPEIGTIGAVTISLVVGGVVEARAKVLISELFPPPFNNLELSALPLDKGEEERAYWTFDESTGEVVLTESIPPEIAAAFVESGSRQGLAIFEPDAFELTGDGGHNGSVDDVLIGGGGSDLIRAGEGNDTLAGRQGAEYMMGGSGDDLLSGGLGNDRIDGESGTDTAIFLEKQERIYVELNGEQPDEVFVGGTLEDTLLGVENIKAGQSNDFVLGNNEANVLIGEAGNDVLFGRDGPDRLVGGPGQDAIGGGPGADSFVYFNPQEGPDTVLDFSQGEADRIIVSASGFGGGLVPGQSVPLIVIGQGLVEVAPASSHFIFHKGGVESGALYWDATGSGSASAIKLLQLPIEAELGAIDIEVTN